MKLDANFFEKFEAVWQAVWAYIYDILKYFKVIDVKADAEADAE